MKHKNRMVSHGSTIQRKNENILRTWVPIWVPFSLIRPSVPPGRKPETWILCLSLLYFF